MIDPTTGSHLVTVNTPAGERQLKKLSPADWVRLGNTMRASRKAALRQELKDLGTDAAATKKALDEFDRRPVRYRDVEGFVNTLEGQFSAILYSLQKDNPDAAEKDFDALGLDPREWIGVAAALLNMNTVEVKEDGPASPLAGNAAGETNPPPAETNQTSTEQPTESDANST